MNRLGPSLARLALLLLSCLSLSLTSRPEREPLAATVSAAESVLALTGATLIDGTGAPPLVNATVIIRGHRIAAVGAANAIRIPKGARKIDLTGLYLLPGLIDSRVHYGLTLFLKSPDAETPQKTEDFLAHGVTSVKDLGDAHPWIVGVKREIAADKLQGPRFFVAGPTFTAPGGHPAGTWLKGNAAAIAAGTREVTAADTARTEVRNLKQNGMDVIKAIYDSGDKRSPFGILPKLDLEVLKAIVSEAHAIKLRVVVHWGNTSELADILQARPDGLEHVTASPIPAALIKQMAELGMYVVPTIVASKQFLPPVAVERGLLPNIKRLADAGVKIVAGTDAPLGSRFGESLHTEMEMLVKAGLTPMQALQSATKNAAEHLGRADELGTVALGKLADLIAVSGNPLEAIAKTRDVKFVMKNGVVIRYVTPSRKTK